MMTWIFGLRVTEIPGSLPRLIFLLLGMIAPMVASAEQLNLGVCRELFLDHHLIQTLRGTRLMLHEPRDEGPVLRFDAPWEGPFSAYCTVLDDGGRFLVYYRGKTQAARDGLEETTCVAESRDGRTWTRPNLGLVEVGGTRSNNVVLALDDLSHNFSPLLDANPSISQEQRFKAVSGTARSGLMAFVSPDGFRWSKLSDKPILTKGELPFANVFDSQNVVFWSATEERYVMFFRVFQERKRRIARAESKDFLNWTNVMVMEYRDADGAPAVIEELYTNQTHPYFRAPHIYVSLAARFMPGRQVLTEAEARAINIHPSYFKDTSDAIFMSSRGGRFYVRTFPGAFIRPGIGAQNWVSRTTYPALNVVQTGPHEMSAYVNQDYAQPTAHLRRYSLRLDGFASVRAPHEGGELLTKPVSFTGTRLLVNFATSAAGAIRVEIQDEYGKPLPGFTLAESLELIGNEIERAVRWKDGDRLDAISGKPMRLLFVMKDADLYALRFGK
jgi:hypothetical protein